MLNSDLQLLFRKEKKMSGAIPYGSRRKMQVQIVKEVKRKYLIVLGEFKSLGSNGLHLRAQVDVIAEPLTVIIEKLLVEASIGLLKIIHARQILLLFFDK